MNLARQETHLLELLLADHQGDGSESYSAYATSRLEHFVLYGSGIGVMPTLDFAAIRRFLLDVLSRCPTGEWLSAASLVEYLKTNHRYFLIPNTR